MNYIGSNSWTCVFKHSKVGYKLPDFQEVWNLKPDTRGKIILFGKEHDVPRWQQSYEKKYFFSGMTHGSSSSTPKIFLDFLESCQSHISPKLNGILVNWYNPDDYIGFHSDNEKGLVPDEPIVTFTLLEDPNEPRKFRLKSNETGENIDYMLCHGHVFIMGGNTQKTHKHSVPKSTKYKSRRVSITVRSFV
jgi:alkylated DNA repair dioxygenase AlkB